MSLLPRIIPPEDTWTRSNMTVNVWLENSHVLGFEILQSYNGGAEVDRLIGGAKWDGCWNLGWPDPSACMHLCDVDDFLEALRWIESKRLEKVTHAEGGGLSSEASRERAEIVKYLRAEATKWNEGTLAAVASLIENGYHHEFLAANSEGSNGKD